MPPSVAIPLPRSWYAWVSDSDFRPAQSVRAITLGDIVIAKQARLVVSGFDKPASSDLASVRLLGGRLRVGSVGFALRAVL